MYFQNKVLAVTSLSRSEYWNEDFHFSEKALNFQLSKVLCCKNGYKALNICNQSSRNIYSGSGASPLQNLCLEWNDKAPQLNGTRTPSVEYQDQFCRVLPQASAQRVGGGGIRVVMSGGGTIHFKVTSISLGLLHLERKTTHPTEKRVARCLIFGLQTAAQDSGLKALNYKAEIFSHLLNTQIISVVLKIPPQGFQSFVLFDITSFKILLQEFESSQLASYVLRKTEYQPLYIHLPCTYMYTLFLLIKYQCLPINLTP